MGYRSACSIVIAALVATIVVSLAPFCLARPAPAGRMGAAPGAFWRRALLSGDALVLERALAEATRASSMTWVVDRGDEGGAVRYVRSAAFPRPLAMNGSRLADEAAERSYVSGVMQRWLDARPGGAANAEAAEAAYVGARWWVKPHAPGPRAAASALSLAVRRGLDDGLTHCAIGALVHMLWVDWHPLVDGNGRSARSMWFALCPAARDRCARDRRAYLLAVEGVLRDGAARQSLCSRLCPVDMCS
jgi:hypothetical protein